MTKLKLTSLMAMSLSIIISNSFNPAKAESAPATASIQQSRDYPLWWKEAIFYQIYPRSFKDTNGDGIGDIQGIIEKLDYLKGLGINAIWMTPHYDSPNTDSGYDIRDYKKIMSEYGSMEDFNRLMVEMKKRDMRLMIDVVINHCSDQNEWFKESRSSKNNPYRDYFFWQEGKHGGPPNNYHSFFGGSAWEKDAKTGQYYLHYFSKHQPDLNWDNPKVRHDLYDIVRFWLDKGVSGLRFDTVGTYSKFPGFPDLTPEELTHYAVTYTQGPNLHKYIHEIYTQVLSQYPDIVTAGEVFGVPLKQVPLYVDQRREELDMVFTFDLILLYRHMTEKWRYRDWTLSEFKQVVQNMNDVAGEHGWNAFFLGNHDNPRAVSAFGDDREEWRSLSARALATLQMTQRATPFIYQGEELGMTNYPFKSISEFDDLETKGSWQDVVETGKVKATWFLENAKKTTRDNARTPFQWDAQKNGGFTTGTPWINVNPNYKVINAANEVAHDDSIYHYYRQLIALRHRTPALTYGKYTDLAPKNDDIYAYTRTTKEAKYLVVINFKEKVMDYALPQALTIDKALIESGAKAAPAHNASSLTLQPWQSGIYQLN
ncbi:glucohydrolase [Lonsdalea iberica]|uniref:Glucohydrolase n=1 Tax=Lonsdalea iberica TaxID=1082703 RepID=A0ABX3XG10_9GAMM|nr:alpha-glucosidase [Lonsdalea iberica]OSN10508.1 glucohydrolase [Lonsdalea iberica]